MSIEDETDDSKKKEKQFKQLDAFNFSIVRYGLKGFKNFGDIEFKTEKVKAFDRDIEIVPDEILAKIPLRIIHELSTTIWFGNKVSEELRKN